MSKTKLATDFIGADGMQKDIKQLVKAQSKPPVQAAIDTQQANNAVAVVDDMLTELFEALKGCKPAWNLAMPDDDAETLVKKQWLLAFLENGITTRSRIRLGMVGARKDTSRYWPSTGEFISWCTCSTEDLGIPEVNTAYLEAGQNSHAPKRHTWSHEVVRLAGEATGWRLLAESNTTLTMPIFKRNFEILVRRALNGEEFTTPVLQGIEEKKEPPKPYVKNFDLARGTLDSLKRLVG